jgi:hypothetical protein
MDTTTPIFSKNDNLKFFRTLNSRVNNYFKDFPSFDSLNYCTKLKSPNNIELVASTHSTTAADEPRALEEIST